MAIADRTVKRQLQQRSKQRGQHSLSGSFSSLVRALKLNDTSIRQLRRVVEACPTIELHYDTANRRYTLTFN
ncbi:MAG TPA: hypothetical protein VGA08_03610 [Candidatus Saccharimonadales bacterium]